MSFKVIYDTKELAELSSAAKAAIGGVLKDRKFQESIADTVKTDIVATTRLGKSTVTGRKFPSLSESWIKTRRKIIAFQGAPSFVRPAKSNLSLSGELLDSLEYKLSNTGVFTAKFFFAGMHRPYKYRGVRVPVVTIGEKAKNEDIASALDERFKFIGVRPIVQRRIIGSLVDKIKVTLARLKRRR